MAPVATVKLIAISKRELRDIVPSFEVGEIRVLLPFVSHPSAIHESLSCRVHLKKKCIGCLVAFSDAEAAALDD